ncbi:unnamed protein product [Rhizophagus irregularis]|nr:unnamed protein product [Rhizophagus irregularis]
MSTTSIKEQTNNSDYVDWIEKAIEDNYITYFDYDEFTNKQEFENSDTSSVGKIFKANYKNNDTPLIVKTPGLDIKKFINEVFKILTYFIYINNFHKNPINQNL